MSLQRVFTEIGKSFTTTIFRINSDEFKEKKNCEFTKIKKIKFINVNKKIYNK